MALNHERKGASAQELWPKRYGPLALIVVVSGLLALLIPGFFREVIFVPVLDLLFTLYRFYKGLPQNVVWVVFVVVVTLTAVRALWPGRETPSDIAAAPAPGGRVQQLAALAGDARHSQYARWQLVKDLESLTYSLLLRQYGERDLPLNDRIERGEIKLPPALRQLLQTGNALPNYRDFIESRDAAASKALPLLADLDLPAALQALQMLERAQDTTL